MPNNKKSMAWGWIIFWIILFWPLGLFFLFRKINKDKSAVLNNGKTVAIVSYILIAFGVLYFFATLSNSNYLIFTIILLCGGIWANRISKMMKKNGEKYKKYIALIVNQNQRSIDLLSSAAGVPYEETVADLKKMVAMGYFPGAYVNEGAREIVLPQTETPVIPQTDVDHAPQVKVATCGSCGANNSIIIGKMGECEYCGSPIQ